MTTIYFDKYDKFGDYHWSWYKRKDNYRTHVDKVKDWVKEKPVLDVGAGDGLITSHLQAVGLDNNPTAVQLAKQRGVNVILGEAYHLPFTDQEFEAVFMGDTLEHLEFPSQALKEARRVLKSYLYLSGPLKSRQIECYEYPDSKWTVEEIKTKVEQLGFVLEGEVEIVETKSRPRKFYAKFRKIES